MSGQQPGTPSGRDVRADPTAPPEREAVTGGRDRSLRPEKRRRRRGGERLMVPEAEFTSYYGKPVLNKPTWSARDIAGYLFLGGLAGGSSVLAAGAELTGRPALARGCRIGALVAVSGSAVALVHDLGRPERFVNMLRVLKPSSPMSVGSWLLAAYGPQAGVAAAADVVGVLPGVRRAATIGAALLGPAVAAYTAALVSDTAVPGWHDGYRQMPAVFVSSAATAAGGLGMLVAPTAEAAPARRAAFVGGLAESAAMRLMRRRMGLASETYEQGTAGRLVTAAEILSISGGVLGLTLGGRSRAVAAVAGAACLAGSACSRFGIFAAGVASAEDPRYVVVPQRERLAGRQDAGPSAQTHEATTAAGGTRQEDAA